MPACTHFEKQALILTSKYTDMICHFKLYKKLIMPLSSALYVQYSKLPTGGNIICPAAKHKKKSLTKHSTKIILLPSPEFRVGMIMTDKRLM